VNRPHNRSSAYSAGGEAAEQSLDVTGVEGDREAMRDVRHGTGHAPSVGMKPGGLTRASPTLHGQPASAAKRAHRARTGI
jgi:hypothetical protein